MLSVRMKPATSRNGKSSWIVIAILNHNLQTPCRFLLITVDSWVDRSIKQIHSMVSRSLKVQCPKKKERKESSMELWFLEANETYLEWHSRKSITSNYSYLDTAIKSHGTPCDSHLRKQRVTCVKKEKHAVKLQKVNFQKSQCNHAFVLQMLNKEYRIRHFEQCNQRLSNLICQNCDGSIKNNYYWM